MNNPNPLLSMAHLTTLSLSNFKMIEAVGLKIIQGPLEWHYLCTKFHEIYQVVQKLLVGDIQTDKQTGDLIRRLIFGK
jgi:hypothetical protein